MSSARRQNPARRAEGLQPEVHRAARLLEDFSGHKPTRVLRVERRVPKVGLVIGETDFVGYTTIRDGEVEAYIHHFPRKSRPLLASSSDGTQLEILGGEFQFTEAGIEG
ncbi:MAG: hypothetical protein ACRDLF_14915 [Solirubrobacteraceae bacterium]